MPVFFPHAPCGGNGICGKCKVFADDKEVLACQTIIDRDMTVRLPEALTAQILTVGLPVTIPEKPGLCLAVDIGTTTVVAYLMEKGEILATESRKNPQSAFGADVISRIRHAMDGHLQALTAAVRNCLEDIGTNGEMVLGKQGKLIACATAAGPALEGMVCLLLRYAGITVSIITMEIRL